MESWSRTGVSVRYVNEQTAHSQSTSYTADMYTRFGIWHVHSVTSAYMNGIEVGINENK